jgi:hypothetical protein
VEQRQWLIEYDHVQQIIIALMTEIERQESNGVSAESLHMVYLRDLRDLISQVSEGMRWVQDEQGERLHPADRVVLSVVEKSGEWWDQPYAVVPVSPGGWAIIEKSLFRALKRYRSKKQAFRACRQLNQQAYLASEDKSGLRPTPALTREEEDRFLSPKI